MEEIYKIKEHHLDFVKTCECYPEQYDVYMNHKRVAYVRLRDGILEVHPYTLQQCIKGNGEMLYYEIDWDTYIYYYKFNEPIGEFYEERERFIDDISEEILEYIFQEQIASSLINIRRQGNI